jgi:hypothetical protein
MANASLQDRISETCLTRGYRPPLIITPNQLFDEAYHERRTRETNLIEEARQAGQTFFDSFNGDLKAAVAELRRRSAQAGRNAVSLPPNPPHPWQLRHPPDKKAG